MQAFILALHVVVCIVLIVIVLLQSGKEGMGVIFGGGSDSLFGGSGAGGLLTKVTAAVATLFIVTSLSYTYLTREQEAQDSSIMDQAVQQQLEKQEQMPAAAGEGEPKSIQPEGITVDTGDSSDAGKQSGIKVEDSGAAAPATENAGQSAADSDTQQ